MRDKVIKLKEVKTLEYLNIVSDRWYYRANYLKMIWQDGQQEEDKREKALIVWMRYYELLTKISLIYIELSQKSMNFEEGGVVSDFCKVHKNELIIQKNKKL